MVYPVRWPDWLYQSLPYLYVLAGGLTIATLRHPIALLSGLLLISAGAIVWNIRRGYRRDQDSNTGCGVFHIQWRPAYACGEPAIDAQHRALFNLSNTLVNAVAAHASKREIERLLKTLISDLEEHFNTEEGFLKKGNPSMAAAHQATHVKLLAKARELQERYMGGLAEPSEVLSFIAYDVILEHISREDRGWFAQQPG